MHYVVKIDGEEVNRYRDQKKAEFKADELNNRLAEYGREAYVEQVEE